MGPGEEEHIQSLGGVQVGGPDLVIVDVHAAIIIFA
jgi:hypothetical protein